MLLTSLGSHKTLQGFQQSSSQRVEVKDQELPSNSKMYIPVNSAQRWGLPWFGGFSFRDCLPGLPGKMKFLSNVLAPLTKPARQREMEDQDECSPPGQTHYGLTLSLLDFSTTSRSLKFMTYFLLCWASSCFIPFAWKLEVTVICSYVRKAQGSPFYHPAISFNPPPLWLLTKLSGHA